MRNALLIGSEGFVGRHLRPRLLEAGYTVFPIDPKLNHRFEDTPTVTLLTKFDVVIHAGANIIDVDARAKAGVGVYGDLGLDLAVCRWVGVNPPSQAFIAMSSCAVDFPEDPYGLIKIVLERLCSKLHMQHVPVVILRPFSGYGADQANSYPFPAILKRAIDREDPLHVWGNGRQVRDWLHISDLVSGIMCAIELFPRGVPIELGTGVGTDFLTLAKLMGWLVGYDPEISCNALKAAGSQHRVSTSQIARECGWEPKVTLQRGIQMAVEELNAAHEATVSR